MNKGITFDLMATKIGELLLVSGAAGLRQIWFEGKRPDAGSILDWRRDPQTLTTAREQLAAYFAGELQDFDLPLDPQGTPFQCKVWMALREIPFGETRSYAQIAQRIDAPTATRAVGAANGRNPLPIVVPCHRVIGRDGSLTGFGGGLDLKRQLLALESGGRFQLRADE